MKNQKQVNLNDKKIKKPLNNYVKYSGISFKMLVIILLCLFLGKKIDEYLILEKPIFTLILSTFGVFLSIYFIIKDLSK